MAHMSNFSRVTTPSYPDMADSSQAKKSDLPSPVSCRILKAGPPGHHGCKNRLLRFAGAIHQEEPLGSHTALFKPEDHVLAWQQEDFILQRAYSINLAR